MTPKLSADVSQRVLLAEDDDVTRKILSRLIEKEGLIPVAVSSGGAALRVLRQDSDFLVAVFDIQMPEVSGLEVARYMQTENRLKRIPLMMITALQETSLSVQSFAVGTAFFVHKPVRPESFQTMLRTLADLGRRQAQARTD